MKAGHLRLVLGPPGTGKTTRLVELLQEEITAGVPTEAIAFVTFTRAARQEVRDRVEKRFQTTPDDLPWFRTIHSAAYELLSLRPGDVLADDAWADFAERFGYKLTSTQSPDFDRDIIAPPLVTADDALRSLVQWARNRRVGLDEALAQTRLPVASQQVRLFAERLNDYRAATGLVDFPGMLERVLVEGQTPGVLLAFIDEAQDLSPLQIAVVERWFENCARIYIAGDDDQAIYGFQGADPGWLVTMARTAEPEVLQRSFRVPFRVHLLAHEIVSENQTRAPKRYVARAEEGSVIVVEADQVLPAVGDSKSVFVLARNRRYLRPWANRLRDADEPFLVEGAEGMSPLGHSSLGVAIAAAKSLIKGGAVSAEGLRGLLQFVSGRGDALLPHGVKARAERHQVPVTRGDLETDWELAEFLARLDDVGPVQALTLLCTRDRDYLERLLLRHGRLPEPRFRLMTIHAAKGREADVVVVVPNIARRTYDEYVNGGRAGQEAENRVAYVAVTRARQRLILVEPRTRRAFPYADFLNKARRAAGAGCASYRVSSCGARCVHLLNDTLCALPGGFLCVRLQRMEGR